MLKYHISWNSFQWKPILSHVDGQTDVMKLIVAFRDFANAPKMKFFPHREQILVAPERPDV